MPPGVSTAPAAGEITVGSADFPESQLLAQIYGQALEAAGFDVSYELGIGAREAYYGAIEGGEVDLVPEYTGTLLSFLIAPEQPEAATSRSSSRRSATRCPTASKSSRRPRPRTRTRSCAPRTSSTSTA